MFICNKKFKDIILKNCYREALDCLDCFSRWYDDWKIPKRTLTKEQIYDKYTKYTLAPATIENLEGILDLFDYDASLWVFDNSMVYEAFSIKWGIINSIVNENAFTKKKFNKLMTQIQYKTEPQHMPLGYGIAVIKEINPFWKGVK